LNTDLPDSRFLRQDAKGGREVEIMNTHDKAPAANAAGGAYRPGMVSACFSLFFLARDGDGDWALGDSPSEPLGDISLGGAGPSLRVHCRTACAWFLQRAVQ